MFLISKAICLSCNGRGFHWVEGKIVSRRDGSEIATTYKDGGACEACGGTGEVGLYFVSRRFAQIIIIFTLAYMAWQLLRVL
jgi:RecJ-like exonuclease